MPEKDKSLTPDALAKSEKRYRSLFENMSEASALCKMLYDDNGRPTDFVYLDVNPAFGQLTGLDNVVGKNVTELLPEIKESHQELFEIYSRVALTGQPEKFEIEFKPLGAWLSISVYSTEKNYFVAVFDNITRRKQAERRQVLSAEILVILNDPPAVDAAINGIVTAIKRETGFDAVGIRLHRGDDFPYVARDGFSKEFLLAENTLAVRTQDGRVCLDKDGNISLECTCGLVISGQTDPANPLLTPRGSWWTNESSILLDLPMAQDPRLHPRNRCIHEGFHSLALVPLRAGKRIIGILQINDRRPNRFTPDLIAFFEDLGVIIGIALAREQAEEQIRALNEQLKHRVAELDNANKELAAFSYSVSHDLRAPLRHMTGFVKLLQQRLKNHPDEKTHYYADIISRASRKMSMLIDDFLKFSHLGRTQMRKKKVKLNTLVSEVVREIQEGLEERQIRWEIDELADVYGDRALLSLVLTNLISNAVKYTGSRPHAEIKIGYKEDKDETIVFVKDNGAGFDMQYADKLFGVFQRLHSQDEFEGTGIGLANVRRIISRHGGRTWAEGSVGQGATFYFSLPKHTEA
jgi:PAS domain S-box-containing protein